MWQLNEDVCRHNFVCNCDDYWHPHLIGATRFNSYRYRFFWVFTGFSGPRRHKWCDQQVRGSELLQFPSSGGIFPNNFIKYRSWWQISLFLVHIWGKVHEFCGPCLPFVIIPVVVSSLEIQRWTIDVNFGGYYIKKQDEYSIDTFGFWLIGCLCNGRPGKVRPEGIQCRRMYRSAWGQIQKVQNSLWHSCDDRPG